MPLVIEQSLHTAVDTPSGSATSTSWTPGSNELLLCLIANRGAGTPSSYNSGVSGNGLTWEKILERDDVQNQINLTAWRAMGSSPISGGVTVTFGTNPTACSFQLIRISGAVTSGTNGSGAIGATATADTGATDTTTPTTSITTTAANSWALGFAAGRVQTYSVGSGFTAILLNQIANSGGNTARSNTEYKEVASSGTNTTVDFSQASATDWAIAAIEILLAVTARTGEAAITLGALASSAAGTVAVSGASATTLGAVTVSAAGEVAVVGDRKSVV